MALKTFYLTSLNIYVKTMIKKILKRGKITFSHLVDEETNHSAFQDFYDKLSQERPELTDRILHRINECSESGQMPKSETKFKFERDKIFAHKIAPDIRLYGFWAPNYEFIFTHGVIKRRQKADPKELDYAVSVRIAWEASNK